jgi:hypothetical protein
VRVSGVGVARVVTRSRGLVAAGPAAGLLANAWALETLVAQRAQPSASWISDLGARSESTAWLFDLLNAASGVALCLVAVGVLRRLAPVSPTGAAPGDRAAGGGGGHDPRRRPAP